MPNARKKCNSKNNLTNKSDEYGKAILGSAVYAEALNYSTLSSIKGWRAGGLA